MQQLGNLDIGHHRVISSGIVPQLLIRCRSQVSNEEKLYT